MTTEEEREVASGEFTDFFLSTMLPALDKIIFAKYRKPFGYGIYGRGV